MLVSYLQQECQVPVLQAFLSAGCESNMIDMETRSRKTAQSEATRSDLIRVATELFAHRGYADTFTEQVAEAAGVTRGALYHHFRSKEDLFRAVYEDLERQLAEKVSAAATAGQGGPWERMRIGCEAFLDACLEPAVHRIVLVEAPSVLGWEKWREIDQQYGLGLMRQALDAAMRTGDIDQQPTGPLAQILLAALGEAGLMIARAKDVDNVRTEVGAILERILEGMKASAARGKQAC